MSALTLQEALDLLSTELGQCNRASSTICL